MSAAGPPVLVAVGMRAEARLLPTGGGGAGGVAVACAGGDPARLAALLAAWPGAVRAVLSFGIAGGLDPSLPPGAVVVAESVRGPGGEAWGADAAWSGAILAALARAGIAAQHGPLAGAPGVMASAAHKAALRALTGAMAVDLESAPAAAFAAGRGVPFAAIRAVADPAGEALPRAAAVGLRPDGRADATRVLAMLVRRPWEARGVARVAGRARVALAALRVAAGASAATAHSPGEAPPAAVHAA